MEFDEMKAGNAYRLSTLDGKQEQIIVLAHNNDENHTLRFIYERPAPHRGYYCVDEMPLDFFSTSFDSVELVSPDSIEPELKWHADYYRQEHSQAQKQ